MNQPMLSVLSQNAELGGKEEDAELSFDETNTYFLRSPFSTDLSFPNQLI